MEYILGLLALVLTGFLAYGIVPTVLCRMLSVGLVKRGQQNKTLALTFDDGPHPLYTAQVLDLLKQYRCEATFFVVAEKVLEHPALVRRMVAEGHAVGIHHVTHSNSWFLTPLATKREIKRSSEIIESTTGVKPVFYRPPYGRLNLSTQHFAKGYTIVMWSSIFQDWKKQNPSRLCNVMLDRLNHGEIYLLHDDGSNKTADREAPGCTIEALKQFLPAAIDYGYKCVNLYEHLGTKSIEEQKRIL